MDKGVRGVVEEVDMTFGKVREGDGEVTLCEGRCELVGGGVVLVDGERKGVTVQLWIAFSFFFHSCREIWDW